MKFSILSIIYLVAGIGMFLIFALDMEYDRDMGTWLWLLCSQLNFLSFILNEFNEIKDIINENNKRT
jgi:hypothetical protein